MHECFGGSTKYDQSRSKIILHRFRYAGKRAAGAAPVGVTWGTTRSTRTEIENRWSLVVASRLSHFARRCGGGGGGYTRWRSCLRHCATYQKVAGSIPDGVTGILYHLNELVLCEAQRTIYSLWSKEKYCIWKMCY